MILTGIFVGGETVLSGLSLCVLLSGTFTIDAAHNILLSVWG